MSPNCRSTPWPPLAPARTSSLTMTTSSLAKLLAEELPPQTFAPESELPKYQVDGAVPKAAVRPTDRNALAHTLAVAQKHGMKVVPWGGGTQMALGNAMSGIDIVVETKGLNRLVAHEPFDLTATVEAGMTLAELQRKLAERGQFLPVETPFPSQATIGGILATNASGPSSLYYGTIRDWLIGIGVVRADGVHTNAGGRVVKNVTGYDLNRLYIGSLGTLGVIVEASFKITPIPQAKKTLIATYPSTKHALEAIEDLFNRSFLPHALTLIDEVSASRLTKHGMSLTSGVAIVALFAGTAAAVERKASETSKVLNEVQEIPKAQAQQLWQALVDMGWEQDKPPQLALRLTCTRIRVPDVLNSVQSVATTAKPGLVVDPWSGIVRAIWWDEQNALSTAETQNLVAALRREVQALGGYVVVERCPPEVKKTLDVWGDVPGGLDIMRRIKSELDPAAILNPGRFVKGI